MSKTLRTAAIVVGAVALGVATYGAALGPIAAGATGSASGLAGLGIAASVTGMATSLTAISAARCVGGELRRRA